MALKLNSSGGGSVTLDSVNTASNVTITIPATNAGSLVTADSSGNVGIGTTDLTTGAPKLAVNGSIRVGASGTSLQMVDAGDLTINASNAAGQIVFRTAGAEKMRLDASGNLGLGVTPSAWGNAVKAFDIGGLSSFAGTVGGSYVFYNSYLEANNSTWKYKGSNLACYYGAELGAHKWYIAPSGTAGNPITFTQAMTLDTSGNLYLTAATSNLFIQPASTTNAAYTRFVNGGGTAYVGLDNSVGGLGGAYSLNLWHDGSYPIVFGTNNAERFRIDTTGNVTPGVTNTQTLGADGNVWSNVYTNAVTATGDIQATSYNGGQLAGLRNKIINGNMGIFQRGTAAVTVNSTYGPADRWLTQVGGDTFSTSQGSFVSGETLYDTGGAQYFTTVAVTSVANAANYCALSQRMEDVRLLAGQTVTVSFWAKAASGTPSIGVEVSQNFGTGGSTIVTGTGQAQALTTTWTKYSKTFSVPSINAKTIGTANTSFTELVFWLDAGSTNNTRSGSIGQSSKTVSIAQVQLEIGAVATPFEQRPIGMELALCQRYYYRETNAAGGVFGYGFNTAAISSRVLIKFPVTMRSVPTAVEQSGTAAHYQIRHGITVTVCSAVPAFSAFGTQNIGGLILSVASGLTTGQGMFFESSNAAAYIGFSAEL